MATAHNDQIHLEAFSAIKEFLDDLSTVFLVKNRVTPLALYKRLVEKIKPTDTAGIQSMIDGFKSFFRRYGELIIAERWDELPENARIDYGNRGRVYIEIQKFISKSDDEVRLIITKHLLTIHAILDADEKVIGKMEQMEKKNLPPGLNINNSTPEGQFIGDIFSKVGPVMKDMKADNPMEAVMGVLSSGVFADLMSGVENASNNGTMDLTKLMGELQGVVSSMQPSSSSPKGKGPTIEQVENAPSKP